MSTLLSTCEGMSNRVLVDEGATWILQGSEQEQRDRTGARERFAKDAGVAKLTDVFQFQWTSTDSLEDKWLTWVELMRQVSMTSLGDDTRDTLTIARLEKAKVRSMEQHLRLRAPQTWVVLCASVDQYLRTHVDSSAAQPTPMETCAVVSTCACCGTSAHEKSKYRLRIAKRCNCDKMEISRRCADNESNQMSSQIPRAAVARTAVRVVKAVTTPTSAIAVDNSAIEDLNVLTEMKVAFAVENEDT